MCARWVVAVLCLVGCRQLLGLDEPQRLGDARVIDTRADDGPPQDVSDGAVVQVGYVQGVTAKNMGGAGQVNGTLNAPVTAGNLLLVVLAWQGGTPTITLGDDKGNTYLLAAGTTTAGTIAQRVYYAANVTAGSPRITAMFSTAVQGPSLRIAEYAGLAPVAPLDMAVSNSGAGPTATSNDLVTTNAMDLIIGADATDQTTSTAPNGFTSRLLVDGDLLEDRIVSTAGTYQVTATLNAAGSWVMHAAAFKVAP